MGKNKLARWAELDTFDNVIQPDTDGLPGQDHRIKGNWNREIFRNNNRNILELACGKGEYTLGLALLFPQCNFIGIDIKGARMWRGAKTANEKGLSNAAFLRTRIEFIDSFFAEDEIEEIWITFPDPHPGKKNSNKRLTCPWFLNTYRKFLKDQGIIHLKTDNEELFNYTGNLAGQNGLEILFSTSDMHSMNAGDLKVSEYLIPDLVKPKERADLLEKIIALRTHYESKFLDKGIKINYLSFRLSKNRAISHGWDETI